MGFWLAGFQISPFPIDFGGCPYNSAMVPRALWLHYKNPVSSRTKLRNLLRLGYLHVSITKRHGTILPSCRHPTVVWHAVQATFAVITDPSAGCPPDDASHSVQLLETEPSPMLVLGCGIVCQQTLLRMTRFHSSAENLKQFYLDSLLVIFCLSFSSRSLQFLACDSIYAIARYMLSPVRLSVCPSVRTTGESVKDG